MTNYSKGANFERSICADLTQRGALCVRAAGSHGIADVIAIWPNGPAWLIQAKTNGKMSGADMRELGRTAHAYGMVPVKASRPKRGKLLYERYHSFANSGYQWSELTP